MDLAGSGLGCVRHLIPTHDGHGPVSAKTARVLAVGLALFGSISVTDRIGWWGVLLIDAVLLPVCVVRLLQSRLEPAQPGH